MNRISKLCFICFFSICAYAQGQDADPVIMNIAGRNITRSEFEYSFNKNNNGKKDTDKKSIENYADKFIEYKLKVRAALDNKLDTLQSFKTEFSKYRDNLLKDYLIDSLYIDSVAKKVYKNVQESVGDKDLLLVSHILISVPQKATDAVKTKMKLKADSVYAKLKAGSSFVTLAQKYSDDKSSAQKGGELPWIGPKSSLPEFTAKAYTMQPGEISEPVLTAAGYHIIKLLERKKLPSYQEQKPEIVKLLKNTGIDAKAVESGISRQQREAHGTLSKEDVIQNALTKASQNNPNLKYLVNEYHDGLLMYDATNNLVWKSAAADKAGLESYFKKNAKKYAWAKPRFKGFLVMAKNKNFLDQAIKLIANCDSRESGVAAVKKVLGPSVTRQIIIKYGVFKEGDDARIDYLKFGKAAPKANRMMPCYDVSGKMLDKPSVYTDDKAKVVSDYQNYKEQEWLKNLHKQYPVTVNKDILLTVNNH